MTTLYTYNFRLNLPDFRMGPWHDLVNDDFKKIDSLIIAALNKGNILPWENDTHYYIGWVTLDKLDGTVWMAYAEHDSSSAPVTFAEERALYPDLWKKLMVGFSPRGPWQNNTMYLPWDLVYDAARGIMALCLQRHVSNLTGSIVDDKEYWAFLLDMNEAGLIQAKDVMYDDTVSGIPAANVQVAIDYLQTQILNILVQIGAINTHLTTIDGQIVAINNHLAIIDGHLTTIDNSIAAIIAKNNAQDAAIAAIPAGATGPAGPMGPMGPMGPAGAAGAPGADGSVNVTPGAVGSYYMDMGGGVPGPGTWVIVSSCEAFFPTETGGYTLHWYLQLRTA